jgi:hypothetical protein
VLARIASMEEMIRPLVPLADTITNLEATITDQGRDQTSLHVALTWLEATVRDLGRANANNQGRHRAPGTDDEDAGDDIAPSTHKLEFPKFDGSGDPLPGLNRCERYFRVRCTPDHKRVAYAAFHLLDDTQLCFHRLELNCGQPDWNCFIQLVNARFGPPLTDSPIGELTMLRRTGSVNDYCNRFMALSYRDLTLTETQQVQLFITGLGNPLRTDVALMQPRTLADAVVFARAYEQRGVITASTTTPTRAPSRSFEKTAGATPVQSVASSGASSPAAPPSRRPHSSYRRWRSRNVGSRALVSAAMTSTHRTTARSASNYL